MKKIKPKELLPFALKVAGLCYLINIIFNLDANVFRTALDLGIGLNLIFYPYTSDDYQRKIESIKDVFNSEMHTDFYTAILLIMAQILIVIGAVGLLLDL